MGEPWTCCPPTLSPTSVGYPLAAGEALGVGAAPASTSPWFTALAQCTTNITPAACGRRKRVQTAQSPALGVPSHSPPAQDLTGRPLTSIHPWWRTRAEKPTFTCSLEFRLRAGQGQWDGLVMSAGSPGCSKEPHHGRNGASSPPPQHGPGVLVQLLGLTALETRLTTPTMTRKEPLPISPIHPSLGLQLPP
jgi:hypothetical protein